MCLIDFYYSCSNKGYVLNLIRDRRTNAKLKYENEINTFTFANFTAQDFNLFFVILWHIRQKRVKKIAINFEELRKLFMPDIKNKKRFFDEILKFGRKLIGVAITKQKINREATIKSFANYVEACPIKERIVIEITDFTYKALFHFNYFTKFDLNEFCSLQNKYTKTLFRLLKQYENVNENPVNGLKNIVMEKQEFLEFMNCPEKYMNNMSMYIDKKILIPAMKELNESSQSFKNVNYQKIKEGGAIKRFEISFQTLQ